MIYRVKPGCVIFHDDKEYKGGETVELTEVQALVHAANVEVSTNDQPQKEEDEISQPATIKEILESTEGSKSELDLMPTEAGTHQPIGDTPTQLESASEVPTPEGVTVPDPVVVESPTNVTTGKSKSVSK